MASSLHSVVLATLSKDNWSDGISRQGEQDPWFQRHGFRLFHTYPLLMLLQLPYHLIAKVFQFVKVLRVC